MFDDAVLFRMSAHHETRGVMQEQQRCAGLVAELDKLRRLGSAGRRDRAVVADNAHRVTFNADGAAHGLVVVAVLEIHELRAVGYAGEDFTHVIRLLGVAGNNAQQLFGWVERLFPFRLPRRGQLLVPGQGVEHIAGVADAVGVVLGQVFRRAGHFCVHLCAAELFIGSDFAGGRFQ